MLRDERDGALNLSFVAPLFCDLWQQRCCKCFTLAAVPTLLRGKQA